MRPLRLYINVDHVATIREARHTDEPVPLVAARDAEAHGADGITIHLREDRRHIQDRDAEEIAAGVTTVCNLELATREEIVDIACRLRPYQVTIVPERREEVTTEGGLDLHHRDPYLRTALRRLDEAGIHVALFIGPDIDTIEAAKDLGVPAVELHTGRYAHGWEADGAALAELRRAAEYAAGIGLAVHAGHGLTYRNVTPVAGIPEIEELNIGHSIISRAVFDGIGPAVRAMKRLLEDARVSTASRRAEFFAIEAREYLADLGTSAAVDSPDLERLVRGARALRGAALMAGLGTYARASAGLEALARQVRDQTTPWLPAAKATWLDGLQTLKELTERAPGWEAVDDRAALALADRIERVTGGGPKVTAPVAPALTPGVRAFIARESATIAGTLAEASRALDPVPPQAALAAVLERMRALRGLGGAAELSPLPELLDAMEMATRTLLSDMPPPPNVAVLFAEAANVLGAMARSMADEGRIQQPRELAGLAESLLSSYAGELDVLPIAALAPIGMESLLHLGVPPHLAGDPTPVPLELVGVGDHLLESAAALQRSPSSAATDLRLFVLHRTLVTMPPRSPTGRFLAPLARAIATAVAAGVARSDGERFLALLREAGRFLTRAGNNPADRELLQARDQLAATFLGAAGHPVRDLSPAAPPPLLAKPRQPQPRRPMAPAREETIVPIESLAPDDEPIVAIDSLAPDDEPIVAIESLAPDDEPIVTIESLAPDDEPIVTIESLAPAQGTDVGGLVPAEAAGSAGRLELAFRRRSELDRSRGDEAPSLEQLIGAGIVPIGQLCYRGAAALARAAQVREEINGLLAEPTVSLDRLRPYIQELLDLVPLARDAA